MENNLKTTWLVLGAVFLVAIILLISIFGRSYSQIGSPTQPTIPASCQYGYVCGIQADGCAVPGAVYNCPAIIVNSTPQNTTNQNSTVAVNLTQELNNSVNQGFNLTQNMFYAASAYECSKQLISACENNVPSQYICINGQYASTVSSQYQHAHSTPGACPDFMLEGTISCGIVNNYCVVLREASSP